MTTTYRTYKTPAGNVDNLFRSGFRTMSTVLQARQQEELAANQYNMESGLPLEDAFRAEFGSLFEEPYGVDAGKIVDGNGDTCGDCDFVIFDQRLAPLLKRPAAPGSRRKVFAFETTYGVIEVKQTLTTGAVDSGRLKDSPEGSLWKACSKVFAYKQLERKLSTQLQWGINHPLGLLFFFDCQLDLSTEESRDALLAEFNLINATVAPEHRVNGLYVLDKAAVNWAITPNPTSTTFLSLAHPIETPGRPVWLTFSDSGADTLYRMFTLLWSTLARTQLGAPDLLNEYGGAAYLKGGKVRSLPATTAAGIKVQRHSAPPSKGAT